VVQREVKWVAVAVNPVVVLQEDVNRVDLQVDLADLVAVEREEDPSLRSSHDGLTQETVLSSVSLLTDSIELSKSKQLVFRISE
jgi:hypothetical protein